jgi:[acyl-carrier-protein] S-malonyltransferase
MQAIKARGILHVVECGPGKVLAGMVKRIDAGTDRPGPADPRHLWLRREEGHFKGAAA